MKRGRRTSRKRSASTKIDVSKVEVITAEDYDYAEEMIGRTIREIADEIAAERAKGQEPE